MLYKRLKSLAFAMFMAVGMSGPALAAGTTPLALVPQVDSAGNVASGCLLYFYQAGTVATPQNAYQDFGLTQVLPNPVTCDQTGRVPMHWLADGLIHIRLTDSTGIVLVDTTMQVLGPSSGGGGGGGTVDPTTILATGDLKVKYGTGTLTGFVRLNGLTIGNSTSGATERANADTQALFIYLYNTDPNLVVSGGRTGNALNDYNASKTIALPDWRGYALAALGDMGNSATSVLTSTYANCTPTTLGVACGQQDWTQTLAQVPTGITSSGSSSGTIVPGGLGQFVVGSGTIGTQTTQNTGGNNVAGSNGSFQGTSSIAYSGSASVTSNNTSGQPFPTVGPEKLTTFYLKL